MKIVIPDDYQDSIRHLDCFARLAGHDVTVVTCAPNHPQGRLYPGYRNRLYEIEVVDGVRVVRVWTYLAANEGFLKRTLNYVSYMVGAALALPRLARPDVIVSTSPQFFCGLTGMLARLVLRAPWVLEIRDIWPESIVTVGAMRKGWGVRGLEALERRAYRSADAIVAVTDSFVPHIAARCGTAAKIAVIKNGVDLALFDRSADRRLAKGKLGLDGKFVAAYVGTHGMAHGLGTILTAAEATRDRHDIVYLLVGDGAERKRLQAEAASPMCASSASFRKPTCPRSGPRRTRASSSSSAIRCSRRCWTRRKHLLCAPASGRTTT